MRFYFKEHHVHLYPFSWTATKASHVELCVALCGPCCWHCISQQNADCRTTALVDVNGYGELLPSKTGDIAGWQGSVSDESWREKTGHVDGLVQDCSNSSALARELLESCNKPSMSSWWILLAVQCWWRMFKSLQHIWRLGTHSIIL